MLRPSDRSHSQSEAMHELVARRLRHWIVALIALLALVVASSTANA